MVRKLLRQISKAVGKQLRWITPKLCAVVSRGASGRRRRKVRRQRGAGLRFKEEFRWAWALHAYKGEELLGVMQAASPLPLMFVVEDYVFGQGDPVPPYRAELVHARSGRRIGLDSRLMGRSGRPTSAEERLARICAEDDSLFEHVSRHLDSTCVTVMVDERGEVVSSISVFGRVFGGSESNEEPQATTTRRPGPEGSATDESAS